MSGFYNGKMPLPETQMWMWTQLKPESVEWRIGTIHPLVTPDLNLDSALDSDSDVWLMTTLAQAVWFGFNCFNLTEYLIKGGTSVGSDVWSLHVFPRSVGVLTGNTFSKWITLNWPYRCQCEWLLSYIGPSNNWQLVHNVPYHALDMLQPTAPLPRDKDKYLITWHAVFITSHARNFPSQSHSILLPSFLFL